MKNKVVLSLLIIFAGISVLYLFVPGLPETHDGKDHVARIANFYLNLSEGNLIPRWAPNLNWGYGHPILMFLYPLPSYIASFFHAVGLSLVDSVKAVFVVGMVLSTFTMYIWLRKHVSEYASLLGAVLYTYAPYRFVETYVRGDIGENLGFVWMPLCLYFIYKFFETKNSIYSILSGVVIGLLIISHNAMSLMYLPFILFYVLFLLWRQKRNRFLILNSISLVAIGFLISAFFWIPGLLEGKYTLRNIVTAGGYVDRFVNIPSLIYGPWSYGGTGQFSVQLGIIQIIALIASPLAIYSLYKKKDKLYVLVLGLVLFSLLSIFLMLPVSEFIWQRVMLLQNFQFPWRFLAIPVFSLAVIASLSFDLVKKRYRAIILGVCIILILLLSKDYIKPQSYLTQNDSYYNQIWDSTTDTGESAPIWSIRFMEKRPNAPIEVIEGEGMVNQIERKATYRLYEFNSDTSARIALSLLYFPGWKVYVDGVETATQFQDPNYRGLMTFPVTAGKHSIEAKFEDTKLRLVSEVLSLLTIVSIIGFIGLKLFKK